MEWEGKRITCQKYQSNHLMMFGFKRHAWKKYSFGIHVMIITNINELKGKKNINKIDIAIMEMEQTLVPQGGTLVLKSKKIREYK